MTFKIVEPSPPHDFNEMDETGYCAECGGVLAVHEPHITRIFDALEAASRKADEIWWYIDGRQKGEIDGS
jgi:hypothetical protein